MILTKIPKKTVTVTNLELDIIMDTRKPRLEFFKPWRSLMKPIVYYKCLMFDDDYFDLTYIFNIFLKFFLVLNIP